jgi:soluble lytic murein transglycosylase
MYVRSLLALAVFVSGAAAAEPLPQGVQQKGGVISMQPIPDSDTAVPPEDSEAARQPGATRVLSAADHDLFYRAFDAADRGDWPRAKALAASGQNAIARLLIQWRYLQDKNGGAPFAEIDTFLKTNADWPRRPVLLARAEETMDPSTPSVAVIAWFEGRNPTSAVGMIRLGDALIATGKTAWGSKLVRDGWAAGDFEPGEELAIVQKDGSYITPDADRRRLDNLIWSDQSTAARRQLARVDDTTQRISSVRIALRSDPRRGQRQLTELSSDLAADPRLAFDRARAARKLGEDDSAAAMLQRAPIKELIKARPTSVWAELNVNARNLLEDGKASVAYQLVSDTGLTSGNEFAEAEFLAGWIALRRLKDAQAALPHFSKLAEGVSRPISLSRARYWLGRTYEALGDDAKAYQQYDLAANAPETFYGQLALARIDATPLLHIRAARVESMPSSADFEHDDLVRAMRVLADLGAQDLLRTFALHYQELHPDAGHNKLLAQALTEMGFRAVAVRVAKVQGYDGPTLPTYAYPVIAVPGYHGPYEAPESALVHAIIRQETEFDPESVSSANARGIMQLTLASARRNARLAGLPYRPNKLTTDVSYNMQLGMTEFSGYLATWNNSLVISAAAYNAGESNVRRWIAAFGDPRSPSVDPIDWIEEIPFSETRNYDMRVLENLQVYRNRVAGRDTPLRILSDLYAPNRPPASKVLKPPPPAPLPDRKPGATNPSAN